MISFLTTICFCLMIVITFDKLVKNITSYVQTAPFHDSIKEKVLIGDSIYFSV